MKSKSQDTQHVAKLREAGDLLHAAADHLEAPQAAAASTDTSTAPGKFDWTNLLTVLTTQILPIILQLFKK